jgi:hypothetical protein
VDRVTRLVVLEEVALVRKGLKGFKVPKALKV